MEEMEEMIGSKLLIYILGLPVVTGIITFILNWLFHKKRHETEIAKLHAEKDNLVSSTYERLVKSCLQEVERLKLQIEGIELEREDQKKERILLLEKIKELDNQNKELILVNKRQTEQIFSLKKKLDYLLKNEKENN